MARRSTGLESDFRGSAVKSGRATVLSLDGPIFDKVVGSHLPPMGSYEYTPAQYRPRSNAQAVNNENARYIGPRIAPNRLGTTAGQSANGLSSALPHFNQGVTQIASDTPSTRSMELRSFQPFPFPDYSGDEPIQFHAATPPIPSAVHVANDLFSVLADQNDEAEFAITGYHRSDPTVLWADTMTSALVPPEERYPASRLLGNGFLSLLSADSPSSNEISFVEPNAPSTLPSELLNYLDGKQERIKQHAEGDAWRAQHAADVVRHHEEQLFSRRAEEGDWGLKGWHMSGEYHGQPNCGKGRGSAFGGRGGRGGGRGGRGRGRGGAAAPGEMSQGSERIG